MGLGVPAHGGRAKELMDRACGHGSSVGCVNLGNMHGQGDGVALEPDDAQSHFQLAGILAPFDVDQPRGLAEVGTAELDGRASDRAEPYDGDTRIAPNESFSGSRYWSNEKCQRAFSQPASTVWRSSDRTIHFHKAGFRPGPFEL